MQRVAAQLTRMQERDMAGIDAAFERLQIIAFLPALGVKALVLRHRRPFKGGLRRLLLQAAPYKSR